MDPKHHDEAYLRAGMAEMGDYLDSDLLYWRISPGSYPGTSYDDRLTIGGLLFSLKRVYAGDQPGLAEKLNNQLRELKYTRPADWKKKIEREFQNRLRQWEFCLKEIVKNPHQHVIYYPYEVRRRVILRLLMDTREDQISGAVDHLRPLDRLLESIFERGEFLWEERFQSVFPEEIDWYLYGSPSIEKIENGNGYSVS